MKLVADNIYQIGLGPVNAFLLEHDGLTLIDTGLPGKTDQVLSEIVKGGKDPSNIKRIILTHLHGDHTGNAAAIKKKLNVPVFAHRIDAELIEKGISSRPMILTPGLINWLLFHLVLSKNRTTLEPLAIEEPLEDNDIIPVAGGIQVIHTPGHSAGHIALLVKESGFLIAGDICSNVFGNLNYTPLYEDRSLGRESILKAAAFDFNKAVFGHGNPLLTNANKQLHDHFLSELK
ncbi:MAG: MBL fold metallo-hydrolase [Mucilaginibacter sp.]